MFEQILGNYTSTTEPPLWRRRETSSDFAYSDGDSEEQYLAQTIENACDLSVGSPELAAAIRDWPSSYHLDPRRADLLRPFEGLLRKRVLELGCGCGAITRYLGEVGGQVLAVEGSPRRARIAASRCRDLKNVSVVNDNLINVPTTAQFDAVLLIGVLEYSQTFVDAPDPIGHVLQQCRAHLAPDGVLILAIENQLGVKYFAGAPEDHLDRPFAGINDLYDTRSPITFGRHELQKRLVDAGLLSQRWLFPFPDYKMASFIFGERFLTDYPKHAAQILTGASAPTQSTPYYRTLAEQRLLPLLARNHLVADLANSFLIVASASDTAPNPDVNQPLAYVYSTRERQRVYAKQNIISRQGNSLFVQRDPLYSTARIDDIGIEHCLDSETWLDGESYINRFLAIVYREGWRAQDVALWAQPWIHDLKSLKLESNALPGHALDRTPFNALVRQDGTLAFFDQEWKSTAPIPFEYVVLRGLYFAFTAALPVGLSQETYPTILDACRAITAAITIDVTSEESVQDFLHRESRFQAHVRGASSADVIQHGENNLKTWKLAARPSETLIRSTSQSLVESLTSQLASTQERCLNLEAERAATRQHVVNLEAIIDYEREARAAQMEQQEARAAQIEQQEATIRGQNLALQTAHEQQIQSNNAIEELRQHAQTVGALLSEIAKERDAIVASKAWRLTAPLRRLRTLAAQLKHACRQARCVGPHITLVPIHEVENGSEGFHYRSTGHDPNFAIHCQPPVRLRKAIRVRFWITAETPRLLKPRLYFVEQQGCTERTAVDLEVRHHGLVDQICIVPPRTQGLRLDPCSDPGRFSIDRPSLRLLSLTGALARLGLSRLKSAGFRPRELLRMMRTLASVLARGGIRAAAAQMQHKETTTTRSYSDWVQEYDTLTADDVDAIRERIELFELKPLISVVMPVYNVDPTWLSAAIESVRRQIYTHWELCIADDCSTRSGVRETIDRYVSQDSRIKACFRDKNGHISASSNSALALVEGEYVALLDHDDELSPHALYLVAETINRHRDADILYSDEDKIDAAGVRHDPYFKPDWNPDLLFSHNVVSHLGVYRRSLIMSLGGFRQGYEGSQDYDLVLRAAEQTHHNNIHHIPHVLYHWRAISGSTALASAEKGYAHDAARRAIRDALARRGQNADVVEAWPSHPMHRVRYQLPTEKPMVSLIVPTRDKVDLLRRAIDSIHERTTYQPFEIIVVDNQSHEPEAIRFLDELAQTNRARVLRYDKPFNYSALNNYAVREALGSVIVLVNNDIEVISRQWLEELVSHAQRPDIGVVGAMLYYPDDTIQHAGVILGLGGIAGHIYRLAPRGFPGPFGRAQLTQNLSAVTAACCAVRKSVFDEVGGLDETLQVAFNDIDFCLRVRERGYRNVWTPYAELYHHESATRGSDFTAENKARFYREIEFMQHRWGTAILCDPAHNPNLTLGLEGTPLAFPPRTTKPWRKKIE